MSRWAEDYVGKCVLVAWESSTESWGAYVGWVVHQSEESLVLTHETGTDVREGTVTVIPAELIQEVRVLWLTEEVREYYRPSGT